MTRERGCLAGDAFHHVTVAAHRINGVVEHWEIGPVEVLCQPALANGHANARRAALTQRPGRRLDASGHMIFRVSRAFTVDLSKMFDVIERDCGLAKRPALGIDRFYTGEMQYRIKQHRGVSVRQHEAIAAWPNRILWIKTQEALPQRVNDRRQSHRRTGVTGFSLLHGIYRQSADCVDAESVHRPIARGGLWSASVSQVRRRHYARHMLIWERCR